MLVLVGIVVVLVGVLGGFILEGGPPAVLLQWAEFVIIGGAAIGSLLISTPPVVMKQMVAKLTTLFKPNPYTKQEYLNLLKTMFELFTIAQRDGLINIEAHIEDPEKSSVFSKNPFLLKNHHALSFFSDTMKLLLGGGVPPHDLEALLDSDIETHHFESSTSPMLFQKVGDSLPGLGIVAAVLGIVITMQAIDGPPEEIGHKVAAALVGTFLGVLMSYGFVQPIATNLDLSAQYESKFFECMKAGILAFAKGNSPIVVVEYARRAIPSSERPSFAEVEQAMRELRQAK
ncbi:MAG: flagellar motor stator protein MotA [Bacteroidetes bacterium]|nr:flagellar motor stator protein MotA [Bacteroidota bacterium]